MVPQSVKWDSVSDSMSASLSMNFPSRWKGPHPLLSHSVTSVHGSLTMSPLKITSEGKAGASTWPAKFPFKLTTQIVMTTVIWAGCLWTAAWCHCKSRSWCSVEMAGRSLQNKWCHSPDVGQRKFIVVIKLYVIISIRTQRCLMHNAVQGHHLRCKNVPKFCQNHTLP